jgi:glycosyltransferase involved in cell wall biosynthesis
VVDGSRASLVGAIGLLACDEAARRSMSERALALARERYAWDAAARRMLELYEEVAAARVVHA